MCEYSFSRELEIKCHEGSQWVTRQDTAAFKYSIRLLKSHLSGPMRAVFVHSLSQIRAIFNVEEEDAALAVLTSPSSLLAISLLVHFEHDT